MAALTMAALLWPCVRTTRTPLLWALVFTALNAVLDPFFIFVRGLDPNPNPNPKPNPKSSPSPSPNPNPSPAPNQVCGFGAAGAASGTALAQTIACVPLLFALRDKLGLSSLRQLLLPRGGLGTLAWLGLGLGFASPRNHYALLTTLYLALTRC
jgi:Na+-driven multidrug efflux pump